MGTPFVTTTELTEKTGTDAATTRGTAIITAACDMVRLFTEQELYPVVTAGTVLLDGTGTDTLLLPNLPVLNAGTVIENVGSAGAGTLTLGTDYKVTTNGELHRLPGVIDSGWSTQELRTYWWPGRQNIQVTCDYGYTALTMPSDLKEVALSIAARLQSQTNGNVVFESQGQRSIRYSGPASDITNTEQLILRRYRQAK